MNEKEVHGMARKEGLSLDVDVKYMQLPVVTSFDAHGQPTVEMVDWPFLLPHEMVPWSEFCKYSFVWIELMLRFKLYWTRVSWN